MQQTNRFKNPEYLKKYNEFLMSGYSAKRFIILHESYMQKEATEEEIRMYQNHYKYGFEIDNPEKINEPSPHQPSYYKNYSDDDVPNKKNDSPKSDGELVKEQAKFLKGLVEQRVLSPAQASNKLNAYKEQLKYQTWIANQNKLDQLSGKIEQAINNADADLKKQKVKTFIGEKAREMLAKSIADNVNIPLNGMSAKTVIVDYDKDSDKIKF